MEEKYYSVKETAEKLGVCVETVRRRVREGSLKRIALTPRNYRIAESELKKFLAERSTSQ